MYSHLSAMVALAALGCLFSLRPLGAQPVTRSVNCDAGDSMANALVSLRSGDTLVVSGTCNEGVTIPPDMVNVTFEGGGSAQVRAPGVAFQVLGREITIKGFDITAARNGINVLRGATAVIDGNTIHDTGGGTGAAGTGLGINVAQNSFAAMVNNTIRNNANTGILVHEASDARIGYTDIIQAGRPNVIEGNGYGIRVSRNAIASVVGATITANRMDGILVERGSVAEIANNTINSNQGNGITVVDGSSVVFDLPGVTQPNQTDVDSPNQGFGISCTVGGSVSKLLGKLMGAKGAVEFASSCVDNITR